MSDVFTKAKRSEVMSRIRSRGNKDTEGAMVLLLRAAGINGWRRHFEVRVGETKTSNIEHRTPNIEGRAERESEPESGRGRSGGGAKGAKRGSESSNEWGQSNGPIASAGLKANKVKVARTSLVTARPFKVRPDFVFPKEKVAVFVDGCFWHGCPWHGTKPASNKSFWQEKLQRNRERDRLVTKTLRKAGWKVVRIWEHRLPRAAKEPKELETLLAKLRGNIEPVAPAGKQGIAAKRRKRRKEG